MSTFACKYATTQICTQGNESGNALKCSSSKFDSWVALFNGAPHDRTPHWFEYDFFVSDWKALGELCTDIITVIVTHKRQNILVW